MAAMESMFKVPDNPRAVPRWRRVVSVGLLIVILTFLFSYVFSPDRLILFPSHDLLGSIGAARQTIPFREGELEIWTGRSKVRTPGLPPDFYMLRFYGNADRADPNVGVEATEWTSAPAVEIWGMNYPGYGGSTGPARLISIGPAALAAYDALARKAAGRPIVVFGTSLGTTAALHVAVNRPVTGLILQNPPPIRQIILRQFGWWNLWLLAGPISWRIPSALDSVANARSCRVKCAFLLAEEDEVIKPQFHRLVVDAYAGEKRVINLPGAHHNDPLEPGAIVKLNVAVDWMLRAKGGNDQ